MTTDSFKKNILPLQSHMQLLAERMLGDVADAEDAVQEVFVHLWEQREKLDKVVNLRSYVMQSTRTRCIDTIRQRRKSSNIDDMQDIPTDDQVAEEVELVERRSAMLHNMLDDLPEKQRTVVRMRYLEEREVTQIEKSLNMSSANVYTTLSRALQTLRDKLKKNEP
ncbi:MAG: sigma-70 family RNA polymerase sigma factor [Bacteroidales bacterium]|nr:sigma-70 family RNA polymerase sigma factor [Bacteroidales bacterium]